MLLNTIRAEWIKIRTTKGVYWTTALIFVVALSLSAFMAWGNAFSYKQFTEDGDPELAAASAEALNLVNVMFGMQLFGLMIILIQSVLLVTGEYGNGTAKSSALAAPKRWQLPVAKWIVYGALTVVVTLVTSIACIYFGRWIAGTQIDESVILDRMSLSADDAWTIILRMVIYTLFGVGLAIGVAYMLRRTAGAMAVVLLWVLVLEDIIGMIPKIQDWIPQYLPFKNMNAAFSMSDLDNAPWGQTGSVVYFIAVCLVIFIAGVVTLRRRDA
ncbi:MAG: ABC transporter permease subunit [Mycobacteriaceae bacterium]|uniref:ABC transporter permease subunit n=1 Tax=Corynebacterium sp. TaxID=1720 RepID=UPI003F9A0EF2